MKSRKEQQENQEILKERLNEDILSALSEKKKKLKQQQIAREEHDRRQRIEENKRREKNKSFEELLNESDLDWKKYK